ncbi:13456_t:CDS:2 [Cetraspora pellucida]|uniref:13456_t:CDS:1 n=1 Tax=Cetraspora pellucida TaxID=1433469 RepID=A0ACA9KLV0_9GLOM|nr:13456_t:CDS:2 [Cetraspora pellucida]
MTQKTLLANFKSTTFEFLAEELSKDKTCRCRRDVPRFIKLFVINCERKKTILNKSCKIQHRGLKAKTATWLSIADLNSLEDAIQDAHKIEAGEYYNKKDGRDEIHNNEVT